MKSNLLHSLNKALSTADYFSALPGRGTNRPAVLSGTGSRAEIRFPKTPRFPKVI